MTLGMQYDWKLIKLSK